MKRKRIAIFLLIFFIVTLLIIFFIWKMFPKQYYEIQPRKEEVLEKDIKSNGNFYEVVGWLQVQGTSIDLPILHNIDKEKYPVELEGYAWIPNYSSEFSNHIQVMGHNIFNLSSQPKMKSEEFKRFEELMSFVYYDFAKENKYIQLTFGEEEYLYKIFMVGFVPTAEIFFFPSNKEYTEEQMKGYLKTIEEHNLYDYDIEVSEEDKIISLTTCTRFFGSNTDWEFYVVGRLVREEEKINNYSVAKTEKYEEIETILKGDEENEEM